MIRNFIILVFVFLPCLCYAEYDNEAGLFVKNIDIHDGKSCPLYVSSCIQLFLKGCTAEDVQGISFKLDDQELDVEPLSYGTSLWMKEFLQPKNTNKFSINIPDNYELDSALTIDSECVPKEQVLPEFIPAKTHTYGVRSGKVHILNSHTILIKNLYYDGKAPAPQFWVGKGEKPDNNGHIIPDEYGSGDKLSKYDGKDVLLKLPKRDSVYDIDYLSIWCTKFPSYFGYVKIPKESYLSVPPEFPTPNRLDAAARARSDLYSQQCLRQKIEKISCKEADYKPDGDGSSSNKLALSLSCILSVVFGVLNAA